MSIELNLTTNPEMWYRAVIDDPQLVSSASFSSLLQRVVEHVPCSFADVTGLEGVWKVRPKYLGIDEQAYSLTIGELFEDIECLTQLVWGRFFLFNEEDNSMKIAIDRNNKQSNNLRLERSIAGSQTSICVSDNTSYFIFTKSLPLVFDLLSGSWPIEVIKGELKGILARPEEF